MDASNSNQKDIALYLEYLSNVKQNCPETVTVRKNQLHYLLIWAGSTSFTEAHSMKKVFPQFLFELHNSDTEEAFSHSFLKATLNTSRLFFKWAKIAYPNRYENISDLWTDSLRLPRHIQQQENLTEHEYYELEDIQKIASMKPDSLMEKRGQAAMIFLFLSGMRVGAFLTLPISCVDLTQKKIYQLPARGVQTKYHKASITTLFNIPELLAIEKAWDEKVRTIFPPHQTWYAPIRTLRNQYGDFFISDKVASPFRAKAFRKEMIQV